VYVPIPPSRYLARRSPGNVSSPENKAEVIVPLNVTLVRPAQPEKASPLNSCNAVRYGYTDKAFAF
jgi:hypothetical protein